MKGIDNPMHLSDPDDSPNQTINKLLCDGRILIGYGKRGHGMNGKDADLGRLECYYNPSNDKESP